MLVLIVTVVGKQADSLNGAIQKNTLVGIALHFDFWGNVAGVG